MVDNAVRINIEANLDESPIAKAIARLKTIGEKGIDIPITADTTLANRQLTDRKLGGRNITLDVSANLKKVQNSIKKLKKNIALDFTAISRGGLPNNVANDAEDMASNRRKEISILEQIKTNTGQKTGIAGTIRTGLLEGIGVNLSGGISKGIGDTLQRRIGQFIPSGEVLGSVLAEGAAGLVEDLSKQFATDFLANLPSTSADRISKEFQEVVDEISQSITELVDDLSGIDVEQQRSIREIGQQREATGRRRDEAEGLQARRVTATRQERELGAEVAENRKLLEFLETADTPERIEVIEEEFGDVGKATSDLRKRIDDLERQLNRARDQRKALREREKALSEETRLPQGIEQLVGEFIPRDLSVTQRPEVVPLTESRAKALGVEVDQVRAIFDPIANQVAVNSDVLSKVTEGTATTKDRITILHEFKHALDFDFGSQEGLIANKEGRVVGELLQPTEAEAADLRKFIQSYINEGLIKDIPSEINAELFARRVAKGAQKGATAQIARIEGLAIQQSATSGEKLGPRIQELIGTLNSLSGLATDLQIDQSDIDKQKENLRFILDATQELQKDISAAIQGEIAGQTTQQDVAQLAKRSTGALKFLVKVEEIVANLKTGLVEQAQNISSAPEPNIDIAREIAEKTRRGSQLLNLRPAELQKRFQGADPAKIRRDLIESLGRLTPLALEEVDAALEQLPKSRRFGSELARIKASLTKALKRAQREAKKEGIKIGEFVSQGVAEGTAAEREAVEQSAEDIALASLETLDKVLEIASPSRQGKKRGKFLTEGVAEGISEGEEDLKSQTRKTIGQILDEIDEAASKGDAKKSIGQILDDIDETVKNRNFDLLGGLSVQRRRTPTIDELERTLRDITDEDLKLKITADFLLDPEIPEDLKERLLTLNTAVEESSEAFDQSTKQFEDNAEAAEEYIRLLNEGIEPQREFSEAAEENKSAFESLKEGIVLTGKALVSLLILKEIGSRLVDVGRNGVQAALAFERLQVGINANELGNVSGQIENLREKANQLGLSFNTVARSYSSFTRALLGTDLQPLGVEIFESVAAGLAGFQLTTEQADGALLALQQLASKGTVSSEELRQQLAERLPGALAIAARSLGKSQAEFNRLLESGAIASADFLPRFAQQLERESLVNAIIGGQTAQASLVRFSNQIEELEVTIGQGLLPAVKLFADLGASGLGLLNENAELALSAFTGIAGVLTLNVATGLVEAVKQAGLLGKVARVVQQSFALIGVEIKTIRAALAATAASAAVFAAVAFTAGQIAKEFQAGTRELKAGLSLAKELAKQLSVAEQDSQELGNALSEVGNVDSDEVRDLRRDFFLIADNIREIGSLLPLIDDRVSEDTLKGISDRLEDIETRRLNIQSALRQARTAGDDTEVERQLELLKELTIEEKNFRQEATGTLPFLEQQEEILAKSLERLERIRDLGLEDEIGAFGSVARGIEKTSDALETVRDQVDKLRSSIDVIPAIARKVNQEFNDLARSTADLRFTEQLRELELEIETIPLTFSAEGIEGVADAIRAQFAQRDLFAIEEQVNRAKELLSSELATLGIEGSQGGAFINSLRSALGLGEGNDLVQGVLDSLSPEGLEIALRQLEQSGQELNENEKAIVEQLQTLLGLKQEQLQSERDIVERQKEVLKALDERQKSLRDISEQAFTQGIGEGADVSGLIDAIRIIGDITSQELSGVNSTIEAEALRISRGSSAISRITSQLESQRAVVVANATRELNQDLRVISQGLRTGDVLPTEAEGLRNAAKLRSEIQRTSEEAAILSQQIQEIDNLRGRSLATQETRSREVSRRRTTELAIQGQINQLLSQGVSLDDARLRRLQQQLKGSREVSKFLSSGLRIDSGQIDQTIQRLEDQLLEIENQGLTAKLELDLDDANRAISNVRRELDRGIQLNVDLVVDREIELLQNRIQSGITNQGTGLDVTRLFELERIQEEVALTVQALSEIDDSLQSAITDGASSEAIQALRQERTALVRELDQANIEVLRVVSSFQQSLREAVQGFANSFGDALRDNIRATGELRIARLEREGANPNEIFQARLDLLQQEKSAELELLRIDQQRQLIAAQQLQTESRIAALQAQQDAEEDIRRFQEDPQGIGNQRAAENALQRLQLSEQQAALADAGVSQLLRAIGLQEDTLRKGFQAQQEAILQQAAEAGARSLNERNLGNAGIADTVNQDLRASISELTSQRSDLVEQFAEQQGVNIERNLILEGIRSDQQSNTRNLTDTISSGLSGVTSAVRGERTTGEGVLRPGNIVEAARQGVRSLFEGPGLLSQAGGGFGGFGRAPGLGFTNAPALGSGRFGTGDGLESLVSSNNQTNARLDRIATNQETQQSRPINVGDINIQLELVDPATPDLAESIAEQTISRIADLATQSAGT